jgi:hypothetical protein
MLLFGVLSLVFTFAGAMFVLENNTVNPIGLIDNFASAIYFIVTCITTVGFGDISRKQENIPN